MDTTLHKFFADHYDDLLRLAREQGHPEPAEAIHDLAIKLSRRKDPARLAVILKTSWRPYLKKALRHLRIDSARSAHPYTHIDDTALPAPGFDEQALHREVLYLARLRLPEGDQAVYELRYERSMSIEDVVRCTGRSRATVFRDLARIKEYLSTYAHAICPDC